MKTIYRNIKYWRCRKIKGRKLNARVEGEEKVWRKRKTRLFLNSKFNPNKVKGLIAKGITQEILATEVLGISDTALYNKLLRKSQFKDSEIAKMADYFDVDVSCFFSI